MLSLEEAIHLKSVKRGEPKEVGLRRMNQGSCGEETVMIFNECSKLISNQLEEARSRTKKLEIGQERKRQSFSLNISRSSTR